MQLEEIISVSTQTTEVPFPPTAVKLLQFLLSISTMHTRGIATVTTTATIVLIYDVSHLFRVVDLSTTTQQRQLRFDSREGNAIFIPASSENNFVCC